MDDRVGSTVAICNTTDAIISAFKLLNALCVGCVANIQTLQHLLVELFYTGRYRARGSGLGQLAASQEVTSEVYLVERWI